MRRIELLFTLLTPCFAIAQQAGWSCVVGPVDRTGYRSIVLPPELVARSRPDLGDLRLLDAHDREVPYVIEQEPRFFEGVEELSFALLRNEVKDANTVVEVDVGQDRLLSELRLRIRKAHVTKQVRLTGSDDRTNWYMVQDAVLVLGGGDATDGTELRIVDIPGARYRYYRMVLNDSTTAPVQVLDVGHSALIRNEGRYVRYANTDLVQEEQGDRTHIRLSTPHPLVVERLTYTVQDTGRYVRAVHLTTTRKVPERRGRRHVGTDVRIEQLGLTHVASYDGGVISPLEVRCDSLELVVENGNDRPLRFTSITAWQLERRMIARLAAGSNYRIVTGDPKREAPRYDLVHFRDSLPLIPPRVPAGPVVLVRSPAAVRPGLSKAWVWAAIVLLMALMAWSASVMLRKKEDRAA